VCPTITVLPESCGPGAISLNDSHRKEYIEGEAVRIVLVGERAWQGRVAGDVWLKSIPHRDADFMPIDPELLDDARRLAAHFGLDFVGVDDIIAPDGSRHLLEVNHVPSVTVLTEVRAAYLDLVVDWAGEAAP
jgi:glutathione synthase/RimK-type ligase-like ATP-grasp enzyme